MNIACEQEGQRSVLTLTGRLDFASAPELDARVKTILGEGSNQVLIDMTAVEYISSAGLRSLMVLAKSLAAINGTLILCNPTHMVREVMKMAGCDEIFTIAPDRASAIDLLK